MYKVFGVFNKKEEAARAFRDLLANGYELEDLSIVTNIKDNTKIDENEAAENIQHKLFRIGLSGDIAGIYDKKISEGGVFLSAPVIDEQELGLVTVIFDDNNAEQIRASGDFRLSKLLQRR